MDQNNFNGQNPQYGEREPLPTMDYPAPTPVYPQVPNNGQDLQPGERAPLPTIEYPAATPAYQQAPNQYTKAALDAQLASYADAAFPKCLASVIMAEFPVASIIAIIMGAKGLGIVDQAYQLAIRNGVSAGGKNIASKVLGKIGKILGIVMTIFWAFFFFIYFIYFIILFAAITNGF